MEGSKSEMNVQTRRLVETRNTLGDGPVWDPVDRAVYWVDILGRTVWRVDADGGNARLAGARGHRRAIYAHDYDIETGAIPRIRTIRKRDRSMASQ
jgi:sugar lactone lactonase YvrE